MSFLKANAGTSTSMRSLRCSWSFWYLEHYCGEIFCAGTAASERRADAFPITYIFGDIFTEVYGYSASRRAIWYGFFSTFLLAGLAYLAVIIPAAPEYQDQAAFATIFKQTGRIVAASLLAYWCGEFANSFTLAKLKLATGGKHLWTRTIGSTVVGQAVDTMVVMFAAFYGTRPVSVILNLIFRAT